MKDHFSTQSAAYARFRPGYPDELVQFLVEHTPGRGAAWDCGTGNGQLAIKLSPHFRTVYATDISEAQLGNATPATNIIYKRESADRSSFGDGQFDLVTVAQAVHWFSFDAFYREVYRTLKDDGLFAVVGYSLLSINTAVDGVIQHFYKDITGPYWDPERRYIDEDYTTISFPFEEIPAPPMTAEIELSAEGLFGYLASWSAVQHYVKARGSDPVELIRDALTGAWGKASHLTASLPILLRAGRKRLGVYSHRAIIQ